MTNKTKPLVITVVALNQVQTGLASTDPRIRDAAESVLSALVLRLRETQTTLPAELMESVKILRMYSSEVGGNQFKVADK
jgi:hypothetical protein